MTPTEQAQWKRRQRWAASMGGFGSQRYRALLCEAIDFAGVDHVGEYLDMAQRIDEEYQEHKRARAATRVRAAVARRRAELAASAALQRATEIKLAADDLLSDPRLADDPDSGTQAPMGRAEVDIELRAALGLAPRSPTLYREMMPPVGDLARTIGLRS